MQMTAVVAKREADGTAKLVERVNKVALVTAQSPK